MGVNGGVTYKGMCKECRVSKRVPVPGHEDRKHLFCLYYNRSCRSVAKNCLGPK
jgi:hypothetical protein